MYTIYLSSIQQEWNKERINQIKQQLKQHPEDDGSAPVQSMFSTLLKFNFNSLYFSWSSVCAHWVSQRSHENPQEGNAHMHTNVSANNPFGRFFLQALCLAMTSHSLQEGHSPHVQYQERIRGRSVQQWFIQTEILPPCVVRDFPIRKFMECGQLTGRQVFTSCQLM